MTERSSEPFAGREPPPALRQRITETLRRDGLIEPRSIRIRRLLVQGTIAAILLAGAFWAGQWQRPTPSDARPQFLLLLYEDSAYRDDRPTREIVAEYADWADSLRQERSLVLAEKLALEHAELPGGASQTPVGLPTGLFIVRANDLASARTIAGTSPHIRQGGRIAVHAIDR
jgi:hypothetical protein